MVWPNDHLAPGVDNLLPSTERPKYREVSSEGETRYLGVVSNSVLGRSPSVLSEAERREWFREIARDEELSRLQAQTLGIPDVPIEKHFPCLFHRTSQSKDPGAALYRGKRSGEIVYRDFHATRPHGFLTLPEALASLLIGKPTKLSRSAMIYWRLRLLVESGLLAPADVPLPALSSHAPGSVQKARAGFLLALACRWIIEPDSPMPFSRSFAIPWCGLRNESEARYAIEDLIRRKTIRKVGELRTQYARPAALYLPGD